VHDGRVSFEDDAHAAIDWLARYKERVGEAPVLSRAGPGEIRAALPDAAPEQPATFAGLLEELDSAVFPGLTHWQSPRFFAYFSTTGSDPAVLAELLAAGLNQIGILWRTSPALQELEETTLDWLAQLLGLPAGLHGHLEGGASLATLGALAAAREARPDARTVVCSEHAHSSVDKACRLLQLELRKAPVDDDFRLRRDALDLSDACAVVATVGTTSSTSVDPVAPIADACAREGVWLHVDAAYAGVAAICPEFRWAFDGVERADSLVVNPHKWLLVPMGCSALWTRRPEAFLDAFSLVPEYLRTPDAVSSSHEYGPELGRPFRALKLWAVLRCYGAEGLRERIRDSVRLAELFESWVREEPGWELAAPRPFSVVCFRRDASDEENEALLERVNARGRIFISHTRLAGRYVLRLAIGAGKTTDDDVRLAWDELLEAAR
jgi:aromatic-L-amino-acid/L-tryptophan decarboxylase